MSGTIPLSMTQQFDVYGAPLSGGALYIMQAGTVATPQNPYQDAGLTIVMPNPIILDAAGRIPQFFLADGYIKIRLTDASGIVQLASDGILVIGPSAGGGGGGGVDPTAIMTTGDIKTRYDTAVIAGFVRANGRTIGPASSGAVELADSTANALFQFLWNKDSSLVVLPSRGSTSAADWAAGNKTIALPDWRGYALAGLDDMGNVQANRLSTAYFGSSPIVLGAIGGVEGRVLTQAQCALPTHAHNIFFTDPGHFHSVNYAIPVVQFNYAVAGSQGGQASTVNTDSKITNAYIGSAPFINDSTTSSAGFGPSQGVGTIGPRKLLTIYVKL